MTMHYCASCGAEAPDEWRKVYSDAAGKSVHFCEPCDKLLISQFEANIARRIKAGAVAEPSAIEFELKIDCGGTAVPEWMQWRDCTGVTARADDDWGDPDEV